ncbi:shikimate dehydrogenase [Candidatus Gracilibacteria bacterium]|nr:shikimate dehydrogenase [Candidatus Gracilibacteria bacterium]
MKNFCVIGFPIAHSRSPQLHEAGFREMDIDAEFTTQEVRPENLESWMKTQFKEFEGVAVTIPHKEAIRKYIDTDTEAAQKIGAVNTIYRHENTVVGTNTDCMGALKAIQTELPELQGKKALVLGAGGASRAVIFALQTAGMQILLWNRTTKKALSLADEFDIEVIENLKTIDASDLDLIVNATPVGLGEWKSPLPEDFFDSHNVVFDMVYDPLETKLLSDAEKAGAKTITGDKMLVFQAIEQFKIWHNIELEPEIMGEAFFE